MAPEAGRQLFPSRCSVPGVSLPQSSAGHETEAKEVFALEQRRDGDGFLEVFVMSSSSRSKESSVSHKECSVELTFSSCLGELLTCPVAALVGLDQALHSRATL